MFVFSHSLFVYCGVDARTRRFRRDLARGWCSGCPAHRAGFGGCAVALVAEPETDALAGSARHRFQEEGFEEPVFYEFRPAAGAEIAA
jgi:galactokinase